MKTQVGIEALHVAVPRRYIDLSDLARARGVDPAKFQVGLGVREMAVAEPGEDTVALAAAAGRSLLEASEVAPSEIGMLVVGTETGVDHSKPVASFVQGLLELPQAMRTFDTQHACYGGTAGVMAACGWVASGAAGRKKALVICSDIARYGLRTAGEPTQGAGAVALLISAKPELAELDYGWSGAFSAHVHDFWRPLGHRDAQVDGHYSQDCYLKALSGAYSAWRESARARGVVQAGDALPSEQLARIAYHVPFCKMAKKAHAQLRRLDGAEESEASFQTQVQPTLSLCARVGNVYTGSLYLALAGMLEGAGDSLAGQRVGLFSYGSGCSSEFFSGVVGSAAGEKVRALGLSRMLDRRERIDVPEYERILGLPASEPLDVSSPSLAFRFAGVEAHRRQYVR